MNTRTLVPSLLLAVGLLPAGEVSAQDPRLDQLRTQWNQMVFRTLQEAGAEVSETSEGMIRDFINTGIHALARDGYTEARARAATDAFRVFASELVAVGRRPDGTVRIGEDSVPRVKAKICPIYPFC